MGESKMMGQIELRSVLPVLLVYNVAKLQKTKCLTLLSR